MGANETDINNLKLVLDGYDQPVRIPFDVEYGAVAAKNARRTVRSRAAGAVYAPQARAIRLGAKVRAERHATLRLSPNASASLLQQR